MGDTKNNLNDFKNLYEVRKTVRFELVPCVINNDKKPSIIESDRNEQIYKYFKLVIQKHSQFVNLIWGTFYYFEKIKKEEGISSIINITGLDNNIANENLLNTDIKDFKKAEPSSLIQFKFKWVEITFKNDWIKSHRELKYIEKNWELKKKNKNYMTLTDLWDNNFLKLYFDKWLEDNRQLNWELNNFKYIENDLSRISDIWFEIQRMNSRDYLWKMYILFEWKYITHKNDDQLIYNLLSLLVDLKNNIKLLLELTKPYHSMGFPIEHVSLNYYTRNKTQKQYSDEIEENKKSLKKPYSWSLDNLFWIDKNLPIEDLYKEMKLFKAREKSAFMQLLQQKTKYQDIWKKFTYKDFEWNEIQNYQIKLFTKNYNSNWDKISSEEGYNKMLSKTIEIEKNSNKNIIKKLKIDRWYFLMWKKSPFEDYVKFCDNYKKVAMEYWKRKADVLMLEREKILAERERWFWIITKNNTWDYYINTFSTENASKVYNKLKDNNSNDWELKYYLFNSITLRALDKQCFKKDSSFAKSIKSKLSEKFVVEFENNDKSIRKEIKSKKSMIEDEELLEFYKEVLNKQSDINIMYRDDNSKNILNNSKDIIEFEINLKLECYVINEYSISKNSFDEIINNNYWNSYMITTRDLRWKWSTFKKISDLDYSIAKKWFYREHMESVTMQWLQFWSTPNIDNKYPLRINPELSISYLMEDKNYIKNNPNQNNNRRVRDRYLLSTTISMNCEWSYIDSAFIWDIRFQSINNFNDNFNESNKFDYYYWLDKWTNELVTLWLFKIENNKVAPVSVSDKIKIYKITEKWFENDNLYKNPSYYLDQIDDDFLFKKYDVVSCLWNLTSAKVFGLQNWEKIIILNWDVNTIKKLYEINAKRFIYMLIYEQWSTDNEVVYDENNKVFRFNRKWIYYYNDNVNNYVSVEAIQNDLNSYIKQLRNVNENKDLEDISINRINHLRSAVCANMVWVIMLLQSKYEWYIVNESIGVTTINSDIEKQNTFLWNIINEKLYNKMQQLNQVPPILKKFRIDIEDRKYYQHWKVLYVNKDYTSSACPVCNDSLYEQDKLPNMQQNVHKLFGHLTEFEKSMHHYSPNNWIEYWYSKKDAQKTQNPDCEYDMIKNPLWFSFIKSWDDLATYNIAKKGFEFIKSKLQK